MFSPLEEDWVFCPDCGMCLTISDTLSPLKKEEFLFKLQRYQITGKIARGGMGEVYLAFDPLCSRQIAIKLMRRRYVDDESMRKRFIREARICCHLSHPSIIPVFSLGNTKERPFYTMPFIQGQTLRELLREKCKKEKENPTLEGLENNLSYFLRMFVQICQGVSYSHSRGILHSDLKPENIIVGEFSDVYILDWGLAQQNPEEDLFPELEDNLLPPGRIIGTVAYMPPERALGEPASLQSDVYALGVILYQLLTYRHPFTRGKMKDFRENHHKEVLIPPETLMPHREIPQQLSQICQRCLAADPAVRYSSVDQLLDDLYSYMEGRSEWVQTSGICIHEPDDWEFQENILLTRHLALHRIQEGVDWVNLMISKSYFSGNIKLETTIVFEEGCQGIGFLLSVPELKERNYPTDGYCLWIPSKKGKPITLLRSGISVGTFHAHGIETGISYQLRIEQVDNNLNFFLNDQKMISYICPLPLSGTHIGFMSKDTLFTLSELSIFEGSLNLTLGCLALPDAFLSSKLYDKALSSYRQICYSFADRKEGYEAQFRAGICLLNKEKATHFKNLDESHLQLAWEEFEKLQDLKHGAPLEYLGKALLYQHTYNSEEEVKCLEYGIRKYARHPLVKILHEHAHFRLHESAKSDRTALYRFTLLINRAIPDTCMEYGEENFLKEISQYWEVPFFFQFRPSLEHPHFSFHCSVVLAFWLKQPATIENVLEILLEKNDTCEEEVLDALFCLHEMGAHEICAEKAREWAAYYPESLLFANPYTLEELNTLPSTNVKRTFHLYTLDKLIDAERWEEAQRCLKDIEDTSFKEVKLRRLWLLLARSEWLKAGEIFDSYSMETIQKPDSLLFFLYGCWLFATEEASIGEIHFSEVLKRSTPSLNSLLIHYLHKNKDEEEYLKRLFFWEKKQLYRQAILYSHCRENQLNKKIYQKKLQELS